jgi:hypothetical protein
MPLELVALGVASLSFMFFLFQSLFLMKSSIGSRLGLQFCARIGSFQHAVVCVTLMIFVYLQAGEGIFEALMLPVNPLSPSTAPQRAALSFSIGYFLADGATMLLFRELYSAMFIAHHVVAVGGLLIPVVGHRYGSVVVTTMFWLELTNPMMHGRWMLRHLLGIDPTAPTGARLAAVDTARRHRPYMFRTFNFFSKAFLMLYFPARFCYLPLAVYRSFANVDDSTSVDILFWGQVSSAFLFLFPSFSFYYDAMKREGSLETFATFEP